MRKQNFVDFSFVDCYNEIRLNNVNFLVENPLPVSTGRAMGRKRRTDFFEMVRMGYVNEQRKSSAVIMIE